MRVTISIDLFPLNPGVHCLPINGREGEFSMRQLHVREPWADLVYTNDKQVIEDLMARIQILEARVRELEVRTAEKATEAVADREAVPV